MGDPASVQIYRLLARAMAIVGAVGKEHKNLQQGYQFRGLDDVVAAVQPVFAELGIVLTPRVLEREREEFATAKGSKMFSVRLLVEHTFTAPDGSFVVATTLGESMDSGDKASNKAMSAALKYALTETLLIPTYEVVDRDTEERAPEVVAREPSSVAPPAQQQKSPTTDTPEAREKCRADIALAKSLDELRANVLPQIRRIAGDDKGHPIRAEFVARWESLKPKPSGATERQPGQEG